MNLKLIDKKQEQDNVVSFIFEADSPVSWKAGQFMRYHIKDPACDDRNEDRYFTIVSAPFEKNIMLTTKFTPDDGSTFKKDLQNLQIGDNIEASGPGGKFTIDPPVGGLNKQYVFIAGGIGITPFRSIILDLDYNQKPINITLLYANRTPDFIFKKELEEIRAKHPEFKIEYFVDPERINEDAIRSVLPTTNYPTKSRLAKGGQLPIFYVSGPEPMVEAMESLLDSLGIPKEQVKRDYFPGYPWP